MTRSALFVCNMNSVRSPMAAALMAARAHGRIRVDSAGIYEGELDPFVESVLAEIGVPLARYEPKTIKNAAPGSFDVVIALTAEAAAEVSGLLPRDRIELWPIENPSDVRGGRDAVMDAYRSVREALLARIRGRFPALDEKP